MTDPIRGILLEGFYYNYVSGSFRKSLPLKNSGTETQSSKTFAILGKGKPTFTTTLALDNEYDLSSELGGGAGNTTWLGISRLSHLESIVGSEGVSLPLTLVTPYGTTFSVVPTGALDIDIHNPDNPASAGTEFRVTLTLEST